MSNYPFQNKNQNHAKPRKRTKTSPSIANESALTTETVVNLHTGTPPLAFTTVKSNPPLGNEEATIPPPSPFPIFGDGTGDIGAGNNSDKTAIVSSPEGEVTEGRELRSGFSDE
jgi:hypothetical protein